MGDHALAMYALAQTGYPLPCTSPWTSAPPCTHIPLLNPLPVTHIPPPPHRPFKLRSSLSHTARRLRSGLVSKLVRYQSMVTPRSSLPFLCAIPTIFILCTIELKWSEPMWCHGFAILVQLQNCSLQLGPGYRTGASKIGVKWHKATWAPYLSSPLQMTPGNPGTKGVIHSPCLGWTWNLRLGCCRTQPTCW